MTVDSRPTVYVETYGCQMNVSDSELMLGKLAAAGYVAVDTPNLADVILLNTCAIRDHAEQRVIGRLGELKRAMKPGTVVGVAGCMAQRLGPELVQHLVDGPCAVEEIYQLADVAVPALGADPGEELLLAVEINIEGCLGDVGLASDVAHACGIEADGREDPPCAFDNLAPFFGVGARRGSPSPAAILIINVAHCQ